MPIAGAKPAHARHVLGWTSVSSPPYSAGSMKLLIRWIGKTQIDGGDRILPIKRKNTMSPGPELECCVVLSSLICVGGFRTLESVIAPIYGVVFNRVLIVRLVRDPF
ncbi:hypothetical protein YC2023_050898 [Brassica napus]